MAVFAMPAIMMARLAPRNTRRRIPTSTVKAKLPQAVLALNFRHRQSANPRQRPPAVGDRDRDHDLVGARRVVDLYFHAVEMAAHEGCVLVPKRNVERRAGPRTLLRRRDQRRAL